MLRLALSVALALAVPGCHPAQAQQATVPDQLRFTGYVVDQAGILTPAARARLTKQLGRFERRTQHQ